ncbi:sugar transporter [uncultured Cycloclasticus sp.]|uniref:GumC family protein n=1 Tax=uncultured Cycloclasticus sp. TaxID=172194 RepID=UPI00258FFE9A|nr:sugar transporter [uncultured Cycloclasticus sp.]
MEEDVKGIGDYLEIIRRHKKLVIYPALILAIISSAVAFLLPASYRSTGLILIESQEIPNDLVRSTVTSYADQRIEVIRQKLLTTSNVMRIVDKYKLYPEKRKNSSQQLIVDMFRQSISVDMVQANVTDPRSGRARRASIAFNVSFLDKSPQRAQQVTSELVTAFLDENVKTRTARANETRAFLKEEGNKFQRKIQSLEKSIAEFKDEFSESLPELLPYNLSMVESLQEGLLANQNQAVELKDQVLTMSVELANLDALYPGVGTDNPMNSEQKLAQAKVQYAQLQTKYSSNHPDIKRLKREIEGLELELSSSTSKADESIKATAYKGPLYLKISSKIDSTEREIKRLAANRIKLQEKLADYEKRVTETHQVKRAYDDLTRDYDNTLAKYKELRAKELQAELGENLESENKGESFTLIEPPTVAIKPEKPNRVKILAMGLVASLGVGLGLALLFEVLVGGVRGYKAISRILDEAPLVVVPMIIAPQDVINRTIKYKDKRVIIGALILVVLLILGVHFFVMDLEVFWFKLLRKISLL